MKRLQGLIFDLDGTLLDSAPMMCQAVNRLLKEENRGALKLDEVKDMIGDGPMELVQRAFVATGGLPEGDREPFVRRYIAYKGGGDVGPCVFPHVTSVLQKYHAAGVKLGICTNGREAPAYALLNHLGIGGYFEFVAGYDTFPVHKPNPEHLLGVVTALDVEREGCVYVGDGPNDVRVAHAASMPLIVVTHGYGIDEEQALESDKIIAGFDELPAALADLGFACTIG